MIWELLGRSIFAFVGLLLICGAIISLLRGCYEDAKIFIRRRRLSRRRSVVNAADTTDVSAGD